MPLWELLLEIRKASGLTQKEFAQKIGYKTSQVVFSEKPDSNPLQRIPSEKMLKQVAKAFAKDEDERVELEKKLLYERTILDVPSELLDPIIAASKSKHGSIKMPTAFINELKKDLENIKNPKAFFKRLKECTYEDIQNTLEGTYRLSRKAVGEIASTLKKPVEEYLILSEYMPQEFKGLMKDKRVLAMFRSMTDLSDENYQKFMEISLNILSTMPKKKK